MKLSKRVAAIAPSMTLAVSAKANELRAQGEKVINFGVGEPDFDTPENIKNAAKAALDKGYTKYVAAGGLPALKDAVVRKFKRENGLDYKPSQIVISNGAKHSIYNAVFATIDEGDEVIIPAPYWLTYPETVACCGGVCKYVPTTKESGFKMSAKQLEDAITPKTRMLIFNSPCNPTGAVYTKEEITAIANVCVKHDIIILADEIYEKLVYGGAEHFSCAQVSPEAKEHTIIINGVSKSYAMTGWRLGYLAAPEIVAKACSSFQSHATSNVNTMTQYASIEALDGDQGPVEDMVRAFERRRNLAIEILDGYKKELGLDYIRPDGAFYVMLVCDMFYGKSYKGTKIEGSLQLSDLLMTEEKIAITPGICFGDDSCIRISYALSEEELKEGLERIAEFFREVK
ncbi:MAG: pyridoxal phosphate-dependent aminotransferase [Clostridia bacterium]|nr:pyridoxal phosphate-dependent aminotransferase [Clostridia bacterium]